jgi:hypothetical protein
MHNKNNKHKKTKYFLSTVGDVCSSLNVNSQLPSKKDLIVKSLECLIDHHLQAHIAKHQLHKLQATLKPNFGKYKWIFTKVWRHCITRGGHLARSANKEKICVTLHETCGNEALRFLTNKSFGWLDHNNLMTPTMVFIHAIW